MAAASNPYPDLWPELPPEPEWPEGSATLPMKAGWLDDLERWVGPDEPDGVRELMTFVLADIRKRMQRAVEAEARGDGVAVGHEAHALKGVAVTMGALQIAILTKALERRAREGQPRHTEAFARAVEAAAERVQAEYEAWSTSASTSSAAQ